MVSIKRLRQDYKQRIQDLVASIGIIKVQWVVLCSNLHVKNMDLDAHTQPILVHSIFKKFGNQMLIKFIRKDVENLTKTNINVLTINNDFNLRPHYKRCMIYISSLPRLGMNRCLNHYLINMSNVYKTLTTTKKIQRIQSFLKSVFSLPYLKTLVYI